MGAMGKTSNYIIGKSVRAQRRGTAHIPKLKSRPGQPYHHDLFPETSGLAAGRLRRTISS